MNIKITEDELFDLIEILNMRIQHDRDLIALFETISKHEPKHSMLFLLS